MAGSTLLERVVAQFGIAIDADSEGGQILNSLTTAAAGPTGSADLGPLAIALSLKGVSVHAAGATDALVMSPPASSWDFEIKPPGPGMSVVVEVTLVAPRFKLPMLTPARLNGDETLAPAGGDKVELVFPRLLLVITASPGNPNATATLAPSHGAAGGLAVTMDPPYALFGTTTVLGFHFDGGILDLDRPEGMWITFPAIELYVAPDNMPALAMHGGAQNFIIAPGDGISGIFDLAAATGDHAPKRPDFIRNVRARLTLERSEVRLLEIAGQVRLSDALSRWLADDDDVLTGPTDIDYLLSLALEADDWRAALKLSASGGHDYLWRSKAGTHNAGTGRDVLGAYTVFAPLLDGALPADASGYVKLGSGAAAAGGLALSGFMRTQQITVYGAELVKGSVEGTASAMVFFEVETEFTLKVEIAGRLLLGTKKPIRVRQKSVGLKLDFGSGGAPKLDPVFDPGQGFNLDLSDPGTFEIPPPLGEFLQPDAARAARENPLVLEVDFVTKIDLGVVKIDKAGLRVPLTGPIEPSLTGLGAHLNLGVISGGGYLKLGTDGIGGGFDVAVGEPMGLRINAVVDVCTDPKPVSLLLGLGVEWPVPIPLANSGLGLFGIYGLLGINRYRDMTGVPSALEWYENAHHDAVKGNWGSKDGAWAFGVGAVIGTIEGGFLLHAKGMVVVELPGPSVLLLMKADIMSKRPETRTDDSGALTAVIEISPSAVSVGIIARYEIPFLLTVEVPASAVFPAPPKLDEWRFDMGSIMEGRYVSVRFMQSIRADGYFMVHGDRIFKQGVLDLPGIAVAAGINAALTWGAVPIGLYIRVTVDANIGISFDPRYFVGTFSIAGELHLFIVSIGCSATAKLIIGEAAGFYVYAEVSGSVDFFFFEVSGSVELAIGTKPTPPGPKDMLRALSLHARSHALLPGSGAAGSIDGAYPAGEKVPIDAIPVLQFEMRAVVEDDTDFLGTPITSWLDKADYVQRGQRRYRYRLSGVKLEAEGGAGPVDGGDIPVVWWDDRNQTAPNTDTAVQLALLSDVPCPTPNAAIRTANLDNWVTHRWGDACKPVAEPRGVLWTFHGTPPAASTRSWVLHGKPFPDRPDTLRSKPPTTRLKVSETWRTHTTVDQLLDVSAAFVLAYPTLPGRVLISPVTGTTLKALPLTSDFVDAATLPRLDGLADAIRLDIGGGVRRIRGLLFAFAGNGEVVVRLLDAAGNKIEDRHLGGHAWVAPSITDLPAEWQDVESGWAGAITELYPLVPTGLHELPVFFDIDGLEGVAMVEIGRINQPVVEHREDENGRYRPGITPWWLFAVEMVSEAEYRRAEFDRERQGQTVSIIDDMLSGDDGKRALLLPATTYTVTATYRVDYADLGDDGDFDWIKGTEDKTQSYTFQTADKPPERLDELVLATSPGLNEQCVFCDDPVTIVFSSRETRRLYAAYGHALKARVRAASGNHPTGEGAPDLLIDLAAVPSTPRPEFAILSPFESAIGDVIKDLRCDPPCINTSNRSESHDVMVIPLPFARNTNYVFDIVAEKDGEPFPDANHPLLRRSFSTSAYKDAGAFAADIKGQKLRHRYIENVAPLLGSPGEFGDLAFETKLRAAGWGDLKRPQTPRVTVIWSGMQPAALLIETGEPHWRRRDLPAQAADGKISLESHLWLGLDTGASGGLATGIVRSTDGSRTLIKLGNNARGQTLRVDLTRYHALAVEGDVLPDPHAMMFDLGTPPWEASP